jgi:hypothetical protein
MSPAAIVLVCGVQLGTNASNRHARFRRIGLGGLDVVSQGDDGLVVLAACDGRTTEAGLGQASGGELDLDDDLLADDFTAGQLERPFVGECLVQPVDVVLHLDVVELLAVTTFTMLVQFLWEWALSGSR